AEGMEVAIALAAPVHELDAEVDGALGPAEELVLVEIEHRVEIEGRRDGRLAAADRADGVGFDAMSPAPDVRETAGKRRCRQPSSRAAADDDDSLDLGIGGSRAIAIIHNNVGPPPAENRLFFRYYRCVFAPCQ